MASDLLVDFTIADVSAARVTRFEVTHDAARPGVMEVEIVLLDHVPLEDILGKSATLSFGREGHAPRRIGGIIESVTAVGSHAHGRDDRGAHYALRVVSPLALLERSFGSQIFQEKSVEEIVTEVLRDHGVEKASWRLTASYPKREYCVQYQESALFFILRLLEHEGIHTFVENGDEGEVLVFSDDSTAAAPIAGESVLPLRKRTSLGEAGDAIYAVRERGEVRAGKFVLRDFDFERPQLDLTSEAEADTGAELEVYDYPGGYFDPDEGQRLARVRLEAEGVERSTLDIDAVCPQLATGHKLEIVDAGDLDGEYFAFAVTHSYEHTGGRPRYGAHARLVPAKVPYRPACETPIPVIEGPQTALVVAPAGAPGETIHTDEHGRCKVKFLWDRTDIKDDRASCWMRVAQLQTSGSMMLARIGWEVLVEFLEGSPDRPIVTGMLYNGAMMPPYALPEGRTRTALRTASTPGGGGTNELRFEDKAGAEEIMLHAQHDLKVKVANNAKRSVGNNETTVVGNNASLSVGGNQTTKITKGAENTIGGSQTVAVGGNRSVEVNAVTALNAAGAATIEVGGNQFEMDGNPLEALLALAAEKAAEVATAMADNAINAVQAHVDGAINQVMGPINALNERIQGVQQAMDAVSRGDLSGVGELVAGAAGIPGPTDLASSFSGGDPAARAELRGPATEVAARNGGSFGGAARGGEGAEAGEAANDSPTNPFAAMARNAARDAIRGGVGAAHHALASALGVDAQGAGGASMANAGGPAGDVAAVDATDREKGPGHSIAKVGGAHSETVGALKVTAALQSIDTDIAADKRLGVGAATVQLSIGDYAESVGGSKEEKALGLIVLSKAGESEKVGAAKTAMVGGAVVDKLKGTHSIKAAGPATFIGAFHKVEAASKIVLKCGASEVVIDDSGVAITSPLVAFLAPRIQLPKKVSEV